LRRVVPQKIRSFDDRSFPEGSLTDQCKPDLPSSGRRARTSAAMLGLALSMGASGFLMPRHESHAVAAEPPVAASEAASVPVGTSADLLRPQAADGQQSSEIRRTAPWATRAISRSSLQPSSNADAAKELLASPSHEETTPSSGLRAERDRSISRLRQHRSQLRQVLSSDGSIPPLVVNEPSSPSVKPVAPPSRGMSTVYHVRPGDTLASIAETHGISQEVLVEWNRLNNPHFLRVHQALIVPAPAVDATETVAAEPTTPRVASADATQQEVAQPDFAANGLELLPNIQEPAQEPVAVQPVTEPIAVQPTVAQTEEGVSSIEQATAEATAAKIRSVVHRITPGETLGAIARSYGIPKATLVSENDLRNPNLIIAGQELQVPISAVTNQSESFALAAQPEQGSLSLVDGPEVAGKAVVAEAAPADVMPPAVPTAIRSLPQETFVGAALFSDELIEGLPRELSQPEAEALVEPEIVQPELVEETEPVVAAPVTQLAKANPHTSVLLSQIEELQESRDNGRTEVFSEAQQPILMAAATTQEIQLFDADSTVTEAEGLLSPEQLEERASERKVRSDAAQVVSTAEEPQTVAAAPLGSENYAPLLEPIAGRMVSPELPPLPTAEAFLPEGSNIFNGFIWPAQGVLTSGYGPRWGRMHRGIDIAAPVGTPIYSAAPGVVEFSGWNSGGYGYMVDIRHPDGSMTRYAHNSRLLVRVGQEVSQGEQIAEMGSTGRSTGPHVHFEIHLPSQGAVNPAPLLARR